MSEAQRVKTEESLITNVIGGKFCRWPATGINQAASNRKTNGRQDFRKNVFMAAEVADGMVKITNKMGKETSDCKKAEILTWTTEPGLDAYSQL